MPESRNPREPQPITASEAATRLGVSLDTVYRHGHRLGTKVLGRWRINPDLVQAALTGGNR